MINQEIVNKLQHYLTKFEALHALVSIDNEYIDLLEALIDEYSQFILTPSYKQEYELWDDLVSKECLTHKLQSITAQCVKQVENIRARRLLDGKQTCSGYFENIEQCINEEFGQCHITEQDKLLLVGSGAYPMTLIQVARETGASVIGIDIDEEAVSLGQKVINKLAPDTNIKVMNETVDQLERIEDVTHVIFSSTVPIKYEILDQLYELTNDDVVVAMRFGDGFKSLFNYPSEHTKEDKWQCVDKCIQPNQIFDIALYEKVASKVGVEGV
ncbi:staphylopine biosynthesis enzyme CntL [Mammaliicoccus sciuri]|uniref:Staphylopine biosynthesis enzyme CntL n=2 Tax=Mammaliicoccus sciuri TaxID=1296 RepID=A0AAJ4SJC4_MAMSC|nr:staphylopine biosynthesis enzyme CntL [Mammaliicoccus sciuri]RTX74082.1 staphylopine biosynthesis enzyme CntL [Mammaliicoccus sciuri]